MNEEYKRVSRARSKENGIVFYSNEDPWMCYETVVDNCGKIQSAVVPSAISESNEFCGVSISKKVKTDKLCLLVKIVFLVLAIISLVVTNKFSIVLALVYFSVFGVSNLINFAETVREIKLGESKSLGRFHSAEHMAAIAYEKYQRIPTMKELKSASRFEKYCGSKVIINKLLMETLFALTMATSDFVPTQTYLLIVAIDVVILIFQNKFNFLRFLQILLTNKPTEKELEVALEGIKFFDKTESEIRANDVSSYAVKCPTGILFVTISSDDFEGGEDTD